MPYKDFLFELYKNAQITYEKYANENYLKEFSSFKADLILYEKKMKKEDSTLLGTFEFYQPLYELSDAHECYQMVHIPPKKAPCFTYYFKNNKLQYVRSFNKDGIESSDFIRVLGNIEILIHAESALKGKVTMIRMKEVKEGKVHYTEIKGDSLEHLEVKLVIEDENLEDDEFVFSSYYMEHNHYAPKDGSDEYVLTKTDTRYMKTREHMFQDENAFQTLGVDGIYACLEEWKKSGGKILEDWE